MSSKIKVGTETDDGDWRPPTHGGSKLLWYMTVEEFDQLQQGELSKDELKRRVAERDPNQYPLKDFRGGNG